MIHRPAADATAIGVGFLVSVKKILILAVSIKFITYVALAFTISSNWDTGIVGFKRRWESIKNFFRR
jgi:predicted hotdog family 3-hydroxylacyl-ACP dehydratase